MQSINWETVRVVGNLLVLRRVSIAMLVSVPILASLWPNIALLVDSITQTGLPDNLSNMIETWQDPLSAIGSHQTNWESISFFQRSQHLPISWARLFFASLFAVSATTLYQLFCPGIVKQYSQDDYVASYRKSFADPGMFTRNKMKTSLRKKNEAFFSGEERMLDQYINADENERLAVRHLMSPLEISTLLNGLRRMYQIDRSDFIGPLISELNDHDQSDASFQTDVMDESLFSEYSKSAHSRKPVILITSFLYACSIYLVTTILIVQAKNIVDATGQHLVGLFF